MTILNSRENALREASKNIAPRFFDGGQFFFGPSVPIRMLAKDQAAHIDGYGLMLFKAGYEYILPLRLVTAWARQLNGNVAKEITMEEFEALKNPKPPEKKKRRRVRR